MLKDAAVLEGGHFGGATLPAGLFAGISLEGASFEGALNFNATLLRNAGLDVGSRAWATLRDVNLTEVSLAGADVRGLDLTGATPALRGAPTPSPNDGFLPLPTFARGI